MAKRVGWVKKARQGGGKLGKGEFHTFFNGKFQNNV
jgi:hypothetical protein